MAPEQVAHARVKMRIWQALDRALRDADLPCEALPAGIMVEIGDHTDYEPDALVNCGEPLDGEAVAAPNPVIIVEVLSPSTASVDSGRKLADYFTLPSLRHYLVMRADKPQVIHHAGAEDGAITTRILTAGELRLDPPGISITLDDIYRR